MAGIINYSCESCRKSRKTIVLPDVHSINLTASSNGLVKYSDIHSCVEDIIGVSNVLIDAHYNVRGVEYMKLPKSAILLNEEPKPLIPIPSAKKTGNIITVTDLLPELSVGLVYRNDEYNYQIRIGSMKNNDEPVKVINSETKKSRIELHESDVEYNETLEGWLNTVLKKLETFPPIKLGIIIEIFIFVINNRNRVINDDDKAIIEELLLSHLVTVKLIDEDMKSIYDRLDKNIEGNEMNNIKTILTEIRLNSNPTIFSMAGISKYLSELLVKIHKLIELDIVLINTSNSRDTKRDLKLRKSIVS